MIDSPSDAISLLGGATVVAEWIKRRRISLGSSDFHLPVTTVSSWSSRESIPVDFWPDLIAMARENRVAGITYESMTMAHAGRSSPAARRQPKRRAA